MALSLTAAAVTGAQTPAGWSRVSVPRPPPTRMSTTTAWDMREAGVELATFEVSARTSTVDLPRRGKYGIFSVTSHMTCNLCIL